MPSPRDPALVVLPGAGKLPARTVPASAPLFPPGGGSGSVELASQVNYAGGPNWIDGTANPGTDLQTALSTEVIGALTNDSFSTTHQNSGADRVSARQTAAPLADALPLNGASVQALIETLVTALASTTVNHAGSNKVGARTTATTFADSMTADGANVQALIEAVVSALASTTVNHAGSDKVAARTTVATFADGSTTATGTTVQTLIENVISLLAGVVPIASGSAGRVTITNGSGTTSSITVNLDLTVTVSGLTGMLDFLVGQYLTLSGATSGVNNGSFLISEVLSTTSVNIINPLALTDGNNGYISWGYIAAKAFSLTGVTSGVLGSSISISGSPYAGNNGTFTITGTLGTTEVWFLNPNVTVDPSNVLSWSINLSGANLIGAGPVENTAPSYSLNQGEIENQIISLVGIVSGQRVSFTCGDGVVSVGDFTGTDAINLAVAYWQGLSPQPSSCTLRVKQGAYTLTGPITGTGLTSGQELTILGDGRSSTTITCPNLGNPGTVVSGSQVTLEGVHVINNSGVALAVSGSIRARGCVFEKPFAAYTNMGTPLVTSVASMPSPSTGTPPEFAIFDDCGFYLPGTGSILFSGSSGGWGFLHRDCTFQNPTGRPVFQFSANAASTTWGGLHCERCTFLMGGVATVAGPNLSYAAGIIHVSPNGNDLTMTVDDILLEDCTVSSTDVLSDSVVLLHLYPLAYNATNLTSRVMIGTVTIRGGVWSLPARGNDFAPFFLQCSRPIIEDLTIVGGGTAATATGPVAASGGGCGNGVYSAAMCETLVGQTSFSMGGGASFLATIAASGAGLASLSTGTTGHGLSVHGLQVQNVNQNSFSGDLCLVGPDKVSGSVDVDGVLVTNITTVASLTHLPYSRIYLRPGASYSTGSIVNQGSTGTFRGISWVATQDMTAPGKSYVQAAYGIVSLGFCGDLDVEAVKVLPGLCVSSGAPGGHEGSNQIAVLAAELWDSTLTLAQRGHLRLYNAYANNLYSSNGVFLLSDFDTIEAGSLQVAMDFGSYAGVSSSSMIGVCISPSYTSGTGTAGFTSQWGLDHCVVQIVNLPSAYTVTGIKSEWPSGGATATHGDVHGCNVILTTTHSSVTAAYNYWLGSLEDVYPNVDFFGNSSIFTASGGTGRGFIFAFSDGGSPLNPTGTQVINARGFATKISITSGYPMHEEGEAMFYNYGVLTTP